MQDISMLYLLLLLAGAIIGGSLLKDLFVYIFRTSVGHHLANPRFTQSVSQINEEIIFLRTKSGAQRAYFFQYHNGEEFATEVPRWKVTQTYRSCSLGYNSKDLMFQNTDVTIIWDIVGTALNAFIDLPKGITHVRSSSPRCKSQCARGRGVYACEVEEIDAGKGRLNALMTTEGVSSFVFTSVYDRSGKPAGLLALAYCSEHWFEGIEQGFQWCEMCRSADLVANYLELTKSSNFKSRIFTFFKKD